MNVALSDMFFNHDFGFDHENDTEEIRAPMYQEHQGVSDG